MARTYIPSRAPRTEERVIRGLATRFIWWGEPMDDPVVLLHGWMDSGDTWQFLVDELPQTWSCVALDWRGFGGTAWPDGGYWFPDYLADLEAVLDVLVPRKRARVVGHSMGGNVAMLYAGVRTERLAWLANLEGFGLPRATPDKAPLRYAEWLDQLGEPAELRRYESVERFATALHVRNPRIDRAKAEFLANAWTRPGGADVVLRADPRHRRLNPVLYRREEAEACWRRITIPLLLLAGALSDFRARLHADGTDDYFRSIVPHAQIRTIEGAGHMLHHEQAEATARSIVEFAAGAR